MQPAFRLTKKMKEPELEFILHTNENNLPYALLLLADETKEAIDKYIYDSEVYRVKAENETIAAFCLYEADNNWIELKNIAVSPAFQGKGFGSKIISHIKSLCKSKYASILVGTADCAHAQIRFYEKNDFQKYGVRENFYIENYPDPIIENGVQLKDMILLKYEL